MNFYLLLIPSKLCLLNYQTLLTLVNPIPLFTLTRITISPLLYGTHVTYFHFSLLEDQKEIEKEQKQDAKMEMKKLQNENKSEIAA